MGIFIVIEGGDGSGKTTLLEGLKTRLKNEVPKLVVTGQPGGTAIGKSIRQILLHKDNTALVSTAELMLYGADRAQNVEEIIIPELKDGAYVLCSRYIYSTIAYQGGGRGIDRDLLETINNLATRRLLPDAVLLLDIDPEIAIERANKRIASETGSEKDLSRFESDTLDFHRKVRATFLELAKKDSGRFKILDARKPPAELLEEALTFIREVATIK